jgi:cell division septation protein DedD
MATDDRYPDEENPKRDDGFGSATGRDGQPLDEGTDDLPAFRMDEDDDSYSSRSDDDLYRYAESEGGDYAKANAPDPGYAAFADDIDDPLADWPSPETRLEDLPEMRPAAGTPPDAATPAYAPETPPEAAPAEARPAESWSREAYPEADDSTLEDDDYPEAAFFDDPVQDRMPEAAPPADEDGGDPASAPAEHIDDDEAPWAKDDPRADELPLPEVSQPPGASLAAIDDAAADAGSNVETADSGTGGSSAGIHDVDSDEEALVDDFLNDLDDLDDVEEFAESPAPDPAPATPAPGPGTSSVWAAGTAATAATLAGAAAAPSATDRPGSPTPASARVMDIAGADPADDAASSGPPWIMIAVIVVALALLGAGGYGVIQQRSSLQAEIRELQAQLATAMAPQEAASLRDQQRRIEEQNEALAAELTALEAENRVLGERVMELEAELSERTEEAVAAASAADEPESSAPAAAKAPEAAPTPPPANPAPAAGWFVNFGSYASRDIADSWAGRLEVNSGRVVVQTANASGRTLYRVRVVDLASRDTAERVATALEREHDLPRLWIGRD